MNWLIILRVSDGKGGGYDHPVVVQANSLDHANALGEEIAALDIGFTFHYDSYPLEEK